MDRDGYILFLPLLFLSLITASTVLHGHGHLSPIIEAEDNATHIQTYFVFVEKPQASELLSDGDVEAWHMSFLPNTTLDSGEPRLVYSYREAISGFAAKLSRDEVEAMESMEGFLRAAPDRPVKLHTTHTPTFLNLKVDMLDPRTLWADASWGAGITIGVIDTGAHPTHVSFSDWGMPPPPTHWQQACAFSNFTCNKKIIGAKAFGTKYADNNSLRWHGTHVASIAAGNFVYDAHVLNSAKGRASGMAPRAHLAIYSVNSTSTDIVMAIEEAIRDKVDIISMSLGPDIEGKGLRDQPVTVAAFSAVAKGILFCAAAANDGPSKGTVENDAPWMLTVGSGTTDRRVTSILRLGPGLELFGESGYQQEDYDSVQLPLALVYPRRCAEPYVHDVNITGKIVMCGMFGTFPTDVGKEVKKAGGAAMILMNQAHQGFVTASDAHVLPAVNLNHVDSQLLLEYYLETENAGEIPTAAIFFSGTNFHGSPAPQVSWFSGRGPSSTNGGIVKPDIIAPGQSILAAYPFPVGPNATTSHTTDFGFNFLSGTSMATPHVSGVAALIKKIHPRWSPADIKSALMTTARWTDSRQRGILDAVGHRTAGIFDMGAGHLSPEDARDPGLVYELRESDYISYLCGLGYSDKDVSMFKSHTTCPPGGGIDAEQLNYPSINVTVGKNSMKTIQRVLTNVAGSGSRYTFKIDGLKGLNVQVSPVTLEFSKTGDQASFNVTFSTVGQPASKEETSEGLLMATDRKHFVATPMVVTFV